MSGFDNVIFSKNHYTPHYSTPYQIERVTIHLKDLGTTATIYPIFNIDQIPRNLVKFLTQEYNDEIARGDTLPFFDQLTIEEFQDYWFQQFAAVICIGEEPDLNDDELSVSDWAKRCLGTYFIKTAYPGRCSHICTSNFLVNAGIRRHRIGFYMCECFLRWAPILGYSRCIIELVFETNLGGTKLLERCGFSKVGKVNSCAILKSTKDLLIGSFIFTKELSIIEDDANVSRHANLLTYLTSGQYPESLSREDRSRLRALSYHYEVLNGKLFLKGKEVISDVDEQIRIVREIHSESHMGINRTTKAINNRYYWTRIKQTVRKVVEECVLCKDAILKAEAKKNKRKKNGVTEPNLQPNIQTLEADWRGNTTTNIMDTVESTTQLSSTSPETTKRATRLDTQRIETPEEVLMRQSENVMMNFIGMNNGNQMYQPDQRSMTKNQPRSNLQTPQDSQVLNSAARDTDFASMLNYHNGPSSQISRTVSELRGTKRDASDAFRNNNEYANTPQQNNYYDQNNMRYTQNNVRNQTNYPINVAVNEEEDDEDDDYTEGEAEEVEDDEEDEEEEDGADDTEFNGYDRNRIEDVMTYARQ